MARKPRKKKTPTAGANAMEVPGPAPVASPGVVEVSAYQAAINAMDEAVNALGAIPIGRRNPEFRYALQVYTDARPGIMEHFNRVKERKG